MINFFIGTLAVALVVGIAIIVKYHSKSNDEGDHVVNGHGEEPEAEEQTVDVLESIVEEAPAEAPVPAVVPVEQAAPEVVAERPGIEEAPEAPVKPAAKKPAKKAAKKPAKKAVKKPAVKKPTKKTKK